MASWLLQIDYKSRKYQWCHNLLTWRHRQFFFDIAESFLWSLVAGPSFMSISLLILELWQLSHVRNWPEIRKMEILGVLPGDWRLRNFWRLGQASYTKFGTNIFSEMLLNAVKSRDPAFTLLRMFPDRHFAWNHSGGVILYLNSAARQGQLMVSWKSGTGF